MAANAKQYSDLQQASSVNDTDLVAVAQSDANELKTATVTQVATKVANIVSTDQLTEFVTDVGLGKQVLAQKLNDKGAGVTASDTLVQMAAKIDPLDVVGAKEYKIAYPVLCAYSSTRPSFIGSFCGRLNKAISVEAASSSVIIGNLNTSFGIDPEIIIPVSYINSKGVAEDTALALSNNSEYLAVAIRQSTSTNNMVQVYKINWQTNTATLQYEHKYTYASNTGGASLYVSDDGEKTICIGTSGSYNYYGLYYDHTQDIELNGTFSQSNLNSYEGYWDEENNLLYFTGQYQSVNDRWGLGVSIIDTSGTGSLISDPTAIIADPSDVYNGTNSVILKELDLVITYGSKSGGSFSIGSSTTYVLRSHRFSTGEVLSTYSYTADHNLSDDSNNISSGLVYLVWNANSKYYISTCQGAYVTVDQTGVFTPVFNDTNVSELLYWCANTNSSAASGCLYYVGNTPIFIRTSITAVQSFSTRTASGTVDYYSANTMYDKCVVGINYKRNTHSVLFTTVFNTSLHEAGAYAIDNTSEVLDLTEQEVD